MHNYIYVKQKDIKKQSIGQQGTNHLTETENNK